MEARKMKKLHPIAAKLLADIEVFRARVGIDRTAFGVKAAGDGHFITRVEEGKIPRITTIDRVYAYMDGKTKAVRVKPITTIERRPR
jgi:predicted transcriptional regulator